jgi:hypothetical protein
MEVVRGWLAEYLLNVLDISRSSCIVVAATILATILAAIEQYVLEYEGGKRRVLGGKDGDACSNVKVICRDVHLL